MPDTAGGYRALSKSTMGRISTPGGGGLSRSTMGYITPAPATTPPEEGGEEVGPGDKDINGIPIFLSGNIKDIQFVEVGQHLFANPDKHYTGYAANGFYYENGVLKPTHVPFKATWATEGEGNPTTHRGPLDRFPERIFVITTSAEVVILNADDITVWMRFKLYDGVSSGSGTLLGDVGTNLRKADFANGFLLVATSEGLRVADFRQDIGYLLGEAAVSRSENYDDTVNKGLVNRNEDAVLDFASVSGPRTLVDDDCTNVRIAYKSRVESNVKENITVAAVGHPNGLTAIRLVYPGQSLFETEEHPFSLAYARAYELVAGSTEFFDDVGAWEGDGVRVGDVITTDIPSSHTIIEVNDDTLVVDTEFPINHTGASYGISRRVDAVTITPEAELFVGNGSCCVTHVDSEAWFDGSSFNAFVAPYNTLSLPGNVGLVNEIVVDPVNRFIATDIGVYYADADQFAAGGEVPAEFRYSSEAYTDQQATYRILEGNYIPCKAIAIDPETGNLAVSATNGAASVISEINLSIQQTFRFFEKDSAVIALTAYRNAQGPPDTENT